jgi:hypothetical protein
MRSRSIAVDWHLVGLARREGEAWLASCHAVAIAVATSAPGFVTIVTCSVRSGSVNIA